MAFPTEKDPAQKLVQMNASIPWSLAVMVDELAALRKQPKTQVVREALHIGIMAAPEMVERARHQAKAPK